MTAVGSPSCCRPCLCIIRYADSLLEYLELRRELDTWQERLGYERAATPGIGGEIYHWQCLGKHIYKTILQ